MIDIIEKFDIIDIPTSEDFYISGKELLNFSWDIVAKLFINLDDSAEYVGEPPKEIAEKLKEISEKYWSASKRHLTTALSTTQQGVDFVLKGKIAEISPYLLIADAPFKWPSLSKKGPINFSDFRTIDAQDLIHVINTFSDKPLDEGFRVQFEGIKKKRNSIMHSVDKRLAVSVTEVIESILFMHEALFVEESWPSVRRAFIESAPDSKLYGNDFSINQICREMSLAIDLLKPAKVKKYFKNEEKQRRYFCPECKYSEESHDDFDYKLAVLQPKSPESKELYCPICESIYDVDRRDCKDEECPGNVISIDYDICLTCGQEQISEVGPQKATFLFEKKPLKVV